MCRKLLPCIFIFIPYWLFAQKSFVFQHVTAEDGLAADANVNVFQDAEGFYWFNTVNALQRYDGKKFISYKYPFVNSANISEDGVSKVVEDKEKNLWLITKEGLFILNRQ